MAPKGLGFDPDVALYGVDVTEPVHSDDLEPVHSESRRKAHFSPQEKKKCKFRRAQKHYRLLFYAEKTNNYPEQLLRTFKRNLKQSGPELVK